MRPYLDRLGARRPWVSSVALSVVLLTFGTVVGCEVDVVPFNRLEIGRKFLAADESFQAATYFEESLEDEPSTRKVALALLALAYDRSAKKVLGIPSEYAKHRASRAKYVSEVRSDPEAIHFVVNALEDHNQSSKSAEEILVEMGGVAVPAIMQGYQTKPGERTLIRGMLRDIGSAAVPGIRDYLTGVSTSVQNRGQLVRLLAEMDNSDSRSLLVDLHADTAEAEGIRVEAASALYRLGDKQHRDYLTASLDAQDVHARRAAAYCMVYLNDEPDPAMLLAHLDDSDTVVATHIAAALGVHRSDLSAVDALVKILRNMDTNALGNAAVESLTRYGADAIDPVLEALKYDAKSEKWTRRQRLVSVISNPNVSVHFDKDQEFKLYEHWNERETREEVKGDIARLLEGLEGG